MKGSLYFLGVLPSKEIQEEITGFKTYTANNFDSSHALNSPAHITLFPPFRMENKKLKPLKKVLYKFSERYSRFYLTLSGFNHFRQRVIFVEPEESKELLRLQRLLVKVLDQELELKDNSIHGFTPHMTIAFKDLTKANFYRAWGYFTSKDYERITGIKELTLLKHRNGKWEIESQFPFRK